MIFARMMPIIVATFVAAAPAANALEVLSIASDAWLRTGPSTSHSRITGLPRGTAVLEIAEPDTVFERRASRWVKVHVLEGRAEGRVGWVWGELIGCCEDVEWLGQRSSLARL